MSNHTPFPWGRGENIIPALSSPPASAIYGNGRWVATISEGPEPSDEEVANADIIIESSKTAAERDRLKALNAELLAALEHVKECLRPFIENTEKGIVKGTPMDLSIICQAIAKAKGRD